MRNRNLCLTAFISLLTLAAVASEGAIIFRIGMEDGSYDEFALARNHNEYSKKFPDDVNYTVGRNNPKRDWPYVMPGPADSWAGSRPHTFKIRFTLPKAAESYSQLTIDFVSAQPSAPPRLLIEVNGAKIEHKVLAGQSVEALTNPERGRNSTIQQLVAPAMLHAGDNTITLSTVSGSWALFDDIRLEGGIPAPAEPVSISAQPLPFFKKTPEGLKRAVKISLDNVEDQSGTGQLLWSFQTRSGSQMLNLPLGESETTVLVPDVDQLDLTLRTAQHEIKKSIMLPPAKKWTVYIVSTTHTDIGYTDLQERVRERHAENGLKVLDWMRDDPSFKWFSETYWQLNALLQLHSEKTDEVFADLREKRMGLSADFANMLTGLCSSEALNRVTMDARNLANRGGFELNSVILDDVPSAIASYPLVLANSGIKYFIEGVNRDRAPYATDGLPGIFYWEGVDGSRVLSVIIRGYGMAGRLVSSVGQADEKLPDFLAQYETSRYPYDAVVINGAYSDNRPVEPKILEAVKKWNSQWDYPKLVFALPENFFHYIEKNFEADIPVLKTDFGGWWEDGAGSSALETALSRRAEERAVSAEMLHSLNAILAAGKYPKAEFDQVWDNILLYNEHTWGAAGSIHHPDAEQTVKQWAVKASFAHEAASRTQELLDSGLKELAAMTPPSDLVVFNQLAWRRTSVVKTAAAVAVQDATTKKVLPCQNLPEGGSCFLAQDLPSIGYRCYQTGVSVLADTQPVAVTISGNTMENEFYRVTLNPATGGVQSILDKQTGRELVDTNREFDLGELIYVTGGEGTYAIHSDLTNLPPPVFNYSGSTGKKISSVNGPVFGELASEAEAKDFPSIVMRVRLYHGLKQLDLVFDLDKTETTDKEAVYLAFPFAVDPRQGGLWLEYPDEITEPLRDQDPSACRDWYSVQRWLAVSDGNETVELSPLDTPLITLGHMTASTWPREISFRRGHIFAYIFNNYWHTNYKAKQGGHFTFRFSLNSKAGPFSRHDAVVDGWNMFCPPPSTGGNSSGHRVFSAASGSIVGVEPVGLPLTAIKEAEDTNGFVFRVCDFSGAGGTATINLPAVARNVSECNLVEMDTHELTKNERTVTAPLKPFGLRTFKAQFGH